MIRDLLRRWLGIDDVTLPRLDEIARLSLRPDDILVLRVPGVLRPNVYQRLSANMQSQFPGRKILVLESGGRLETVSPESEPSPELRI